jgi:beta-lactamase superfamily II metal-dependent hydrolase
MPIRRILASVLAVALAATGFLHASAGPAPQARPLDIYWIDVEGGAATLIVSPSGESLLVDTGWAKDGRDARRIHDVATRVAGLTKIDQLILTHYHWDHVGGIGLLSTLLPIGRCIDHGDTVETRDPQSAEEWAIYQKVCAGKRSQPALGSKIPMTSVDITVAAVNGELIAQPLNDGGPNDPAVCANPVLKRADNGENGRSVGFLLRYGPFRFLDLGDLTWNKEIDIVCPVNRLGKVDLVQLNHHGMDMSGAPPFLNSIGARVAVMNNGPRKGGIGSYFEAVKRAPGLEDLWQLHVSFLAERPQNTADERIANLGEEEGCTGHYLKASVHPDGRYTITNSRNNVQKTYVARSRG